MLKTNNMSCDSILSLIDWRFEMAALYQRVSSSESLKDIWPSFIAERQRLYQTHKQSPLQRGKSIAFFDYDPCLLYTSPSPRDRTRSRMPSSA